MDLRGSTRQDVAVVNDVNALGRWLPRASIGWVLGTGCFADEGVTVGSEPSTTDAVVLTTSISATGVEATTLDAESLGSTSLSIEMSTTTAETTTADETMDASGTSSDVPNDDTTGGGVAQSTGDLADSTTSGEESSSDSASTGSFVDEAGTCERPIPIAAGGQYAVEELTSGDRSLTSRRNDCASRSGYEQVFQLTADVSGRLRVEVEAVPNVLLYVLHDCVALDPAFVCANQSSSNGTEEIEFDVQAGYTYDIVVEGASNLQRGALQLLVSEVEAGEDCTNERDDNDNDLVDCQDPSCLQESVCQDAIRTTCEDAAELESGVTLRGNTRTGGTPLFAPLNPTCTGGSGLSTVPYHVHAATPEAIRVEVDGDELPEWFLRRDCEDPGTQTHCHSDADFDPWVGYAAIEEPGDYTLFLTATGSGGPYQMSFDAVPLAEVEPNDDSGMGNPLQSSVVGYFGGSGDVDRWQFEILESTYVRIVTEDPFGYGECYYSSFDTVLEIYSAGGSQVASNDDIDYSSYCSGLELELEPGVYEVVVSAYWPDARFAYAIHLE